MVDSKSIAARRVGSNPTGGTDHRPGHMSPDEFRRHGREVIDWIADYYERLESLPVLSQVAPGEVRDGLPAEPPVAGQGFDGVLADLDRVILPGLTHWQHPSFFAFFPASATGPSILGDLLASGLGVQGMLWATSPAATELETQMLDWLAQLLDLPAGFRSDSAGGGVIQHSASDAARVALVAALHRVSGGATETEGVGASRFCVYTSGQTHSSVEKACRIAGIGTAALRKLDVDPHTLAARSATQNAVQSKLVSSHLCGFVQYESACSTPALIQRSSSQTAATPAQAASTCSHAP
jgi:aromatic-L-amino-acid decarboxylase